MDITDITDKIDITDKKGKNRGREKTRLRRFISSFHFIGAWRIS